MSKSSTSVATPAKPRAVLFDAYGTLFDVYSVSLLAEQLFPGFGDRLSVMWRDKQIDYTRLTSMSSPNGEHYRPFWDLTRAGLRYSALRLGLDLSPVAAKAYRVDLVPNTGPGTSTEAQYFAAASGAGRPRCS